MVEPTFKSYFKTRKVNYWIFFAGISLAGVNVSVFNPKILFWVKNCRHMYILQCVVIITVLLLLEASGWGIINQEGNTINKSYHTAHLKFWREKHVSKLTWINHDGIYLSWRHAKSAWVLTAAWLQARQLNYMAFFLRGTLEAKTHRKQKPCRALGPIIS